MIKIGDIIVANVGMRSWISDTERGKGGFWIEEGSVATVIDTWEVDSRVRVRILLSPCARIVVVSHEKHAVTLSWKVVETNGCAMQASPGAVRGSGSMDPGQL